MLLSGEAATKKSLEANRGAILAHPNVQGVEKNIESADPATHRVTEFQPCDFRFGASL